MRRRRSSRASSGPSMWKGRRSIADSTVLLMTTSLVGRVAGAQRCKRGPDLLREQLRLLPGGEVAALVDLVPVDEVAEGLLAPTPWRAVDLGREHSDRDREGRDVE